MNELADTTEIVEPAAGQVITRIPAAGIEETDRAVAKAKAAFENVAQRRALRPGRSAAPGRGG